jgi:hypothetical protein
MAKSFNRGEQNFGRDWFAQKIVGVDWFDDFSRR